MSHLKLLETVQIDWLDDFTKIQSNLKATANFMGELFFASSGNYQEWADALNDMVKLLDSVEKLKNKFERK